MEEIYDSLLSLQALDNEIAQAEARVNEFGPALERLDEPALALAHELETSRAHLNGLRESIRRLERGAIEKRDLLQRYEERLQRVRNSREVEAAQTEVDLIKRAAESDETEALELMDQALRAELKLDELERKLADARAALEPRRRELEAERAAAAEKLAILRDRRHNHVLRMPPAPLRLYERIRGNNGRVAITGLTADGACGYCFGVVPIQQQVEITRGAELVRCEACGVILHPGS